MITTILGFAMKIDVELRFQIHLGLTMLKPVMFKMLEIHYTGKKAIFLHNP